MAVSQIDKQKQFNALFRAREWAKSGNFEQCRRAVREAVQYAPITVMQWWRIQDILGESAIERLKAEFEK